MVALKDKRKWTLTEYKGEHQCGSRDMNYYSFHDARPDMRYHSSLCTFSSLFCGKWGFSQHGKCIKTPCNLKYRTSIQSVPPLNTPHVVYLCFNLRVSLWVPLCVFSAYYLEILCPPGTSHRSKGWEHTWLWSASFVLDRTAYKHHTMLVLLNFSSCNYSLYLL